MDESSNERHGLYSGFTTCRIKARLDAFTIQLSVKLIQLVKGVEGFFYWIAKIKRFFAYTAEEERRMS